VKSRFITGVTAGFFLAVSSSFAAPPLGCWEKADGVRWCESFGVRYRRDALRPDIPETVTVHPATLKTTVPIYQPVGPQVASIPVDKLLPQYWEVRKSQLGIAIDYPIKKPVQKSTPVSIPVPVTAKPPDIPLAPTLTKEARVTP